MKYPEYKQLDLAYINQEVLKFWQENKIFEQSITTRQGAAPYVFYEGPPSANGQPGIHHVMSRTIKDLFCRYQTLQGKQVHRKSGWDTHGLPIELQVEKRLGITKDDIGTKISVEKYNQLCREDVMEFKDVWANLTEKMGYWVDLQNPYITYENSYIETLWWLLKQLHNKKLLYKGFSIQPYSPAAGTGLSSHELNQPGCYRTVKDLSAVAMFKAIYNENSAFVMHDAHENLYFLAWTTTPWTLPSNNALTVGAKINYCKIKTINPYTHTPIHVVLAQDLIPKYFDVKNENADFTQYKNDGKDLPYHILQTIKGAQLKGIRYEQLLPYITNENLQKNAFKIVTGDYVTTQDGTGIVHTAALFGADDYRTSTQNNLPFVVVTDQSGNPAPLVNKQGRFVNEVTDFANEPVKIDYYTPQELQAEMQKQGVIHAKDLKSIDVKIVIKLKDAGSLFKSEKYEHNYPHCWRTDKPILYYALDSWFIRTTAYKQRLTELNKTINWKPESTGTGRFGNWLENLVDWNLSRSRYWGTPLPIWRTDDGTEEICIGSIKELEIEMQKAAALNQKTTIQDLHRPFVDEIILLSPTGKPMRRETDLIDVWFDSGAMPYAQWGLNPEKLQNNDPFPFNADKNTVFPADFIAEGVDQTRGWFFTLHALSTMLFDSVAFKNVVSNGLVLDKNGQKMSKRLGNTTDPFATINKYGADATRWYMVANAAPWDNLKFDIEGIDEVRRAFFGTLYNTYAFFALYANIDDFHYDENNLIPHTQRTQLDQWIASKLQSVIKDVQTHLDNYEPTPAARAIQNFVDADLSNWYVRLSRRRFWKTDNNSDKAAAYQTLYECLVAVAQMMSPIAPFFAEKLYKDLTQKTSVHLSYYPEIKTERINPHAETAMQLAQTISSLVLSLRKREKTKVRQPLQKILIPVLDAQTRLQITSVQAFILTEVNVKTLEFIDDTSGIITKKVKPNFKLLGARLGSKMKIGKETIENLTQQQINTLEQNNVLNITLDNENFELNIAEVEILNEDIKGWLIASEGKTTVALDINITHDLRNEGIARELINRLQNLRKEAGLEVMDKINVEIFIHNTEFIQAITQFDAYICAEILADYIKVNANATDVQPTITIDELEIAVVITKI
jgi:isoleucyl-tRNA synthetase